jgi:hypothetical protein
MKKKYFSLLVICIFVLTLADQVKADEKFNVDLPEDLIREF